MDGLLLDSERLARRFYVQACEQVGWPANLTAYSRCIGSTYAATERILRAAHGPDFPFDEVARVWNDRYWAHTQDLPVDVKQGVEALLELLASESLPCAVVTSTRRDIAETKLKRTKLFDRFDATVCGGEADRGKPAPDPYVLGARLLGVDPGTCWALEDSNNGTRSAVAAGCVTFQVPDLVEPDTYDLGHEIVGGLDDVRRKLRSILSAGAQI